jgi:hypothetical protein
MQIPLRPQAPMRRGNRPRMMSPRYHGGFQGGVQGGSPFAQFHYPQQMTGPMMSRNGGSKGGGLLAKILGRGKQQGGGTGGIGSMNRAASSGGGGFLNTLTNPDALNGFLNNTQTVIKTAQQLGPVFQQYGPLVRNLPSLWKLYKGLKDGTDENDHSETDEDESIVSESNENENSVSESTQMESSEDQEFIEINPIVDKNSVRTSKKRKKAEPIEELNTTFSKSKRSVPKMYI